MAQRSPTTSSGSTKPVDSRAGKTTAKRRIGKTPNPVRPPLFNPIANAPLVTASQPQDEKWIEENMMVPRVHTVIDKERFSVNFKIPLIPSKSGAGNNFGS